MMPRHGGRVHVVTATWHSDDGYLVGELELRCDLDDLSTIRGLADVYDPRVDVFAIDETTMTGDSGRLFQVQVQCSCEDGSKLWRTLEDRLLAEMSAASEDARKHDFQA